MRWLPLFLLLIISEVRASDTLYSASFGHRSNPAVIFLHGGPGYNAFAFELTTAQRLADSGYFVIAFDQRGCGRSASMNGEYTLNEAFTDILSIYERYGITRANLLGHSWGGMLGTMFAEQYPERVHSLTLTGSPISFQRTLSNIASRCEAYYTQNDRSELVDFYRVRALDSTSLLYSSLLLQRGMNIGLYSTRLASPEGLALRESLNRDSQSYLVRDFQLAPINGLYNSMPFTTLDITSQLRAVSAVLPVNGIYGMDDGLFDRSQIEDIGRIIGSSNLKLVAYASHNVYLDQPAEFFTSIKNSLTRLERATQ